MKKKVFKIKRVLQEIILLKNNYYNWDGILKRAIGGKKTNVLNHYLKVQDLELHQEILINPLICGC